MLPSNSNKKGSLNVQCGGARRPGLKNAVLTLCWVKYGQTQKKKQQHWFHIRPSNELK